MGKNIIICSDGTGNTAVKNRGTNVFKLFESIDLNGHRCDPSRVPQVAFYDDGVGTQKLKPLRAASGATGLGLSSNVRQLYKELVRVYDPGDRIFLFGFSRGAFTVRTLAGLIATSGLIDPRKLPNGTHHALDAGVKAAYRAYRKCYRTKVGELFGRRASREPGEQFRARFAHDGEVRIRFIGVWDTVDAVGLPFHISDILNTTLYRFKFPNYQLSKSVDLACHALAMDDERQSFSPLLWDERSEDDGRLQQVWFAGAHSNVGGGYPKQGMSLVALDWMMAEAEAAGLRFIEADRAWYRQHANADDTLYQPRAGAGVFYRWRIRDIQALCAGRGIARPRVHATVLDRIAHGTGDYAPGNLPPRALVVNTRPPEAAHAPLLAARAKLTEEVLHGTLGDRSLLPQVSASIRMGLASYYLFLVACTLALVAAAGGGHMASLLRPWAVIPHLGRMAAGLVLAPTDTVLHAWNELRVTQVSLWVVAAFLLSRLLAAVAERRMSAAFSAFWSGTQPMLRHALQQARQAFR